MSRAIELFISTFWIGIEVLSFVFLQKAFLTERATKKRVICVYLLLWLFWVSFSNSQIGFYTKQLTIFASLLVCSFYIFKGNIFPHIFLTVVSYCVFTVVDSVMVLGIGSLLGINYQELVWHQATYVTTVTAGKSLCLLFSWVMYHFKPGKEFNKADNKWLFLSLLFPAVSAAMLCILVYNSKTNTDIPTNVVVFSFVLAIANFAMLCFISAISKATQQEQASKILKHQMALQTDNYNALKENYRIQRKATHEFKRHLQTLQDLLAQNDIEAAKVYVDQLQNGRTLRVFSISSNYPVIDVILNQKYQLAKEHNINMNVQVNDLSAIKFKTDELVVLLANLLDNAIEACQKCPLKKEIHCSILLDESVYISIRNTSQPVNIENNEIVTNNGHQFEHGYGIPAIKYVLDQLHAEYAFRYENGWFKFAAEIPQ